jgi:Na+/melibiose symporter-like transporter
MTNSAETLAVGKKTSSWTRLVLWNLALLTVNWVAASFNYYMLTFYMKYVPGDIYVNSTVGAFAEIAGDIVAGILMKWLGFKAAFVIAFIIAGIGGFCIGFISTSGVGIAFFVLWAKFGISFAFNLCYLAIPVLFPVEIASTCFGVVNVFARFISIISPITAEWA